MNMMKAVVMAATIFLPMVTVAETVHSTAGRLYAVIGDNHHISSLTIEGTVDASDFEFINSHLMPLKSLDLSNARIEAYSGNRVLTGLSKYEADELPAYSLAGVGIEKVILPSGLKTIGEGAFSTSKIVSVTIPETVVRIDDYAFAGCHRLESITIPRSMTAIGTGAFADCPALEKADFGNAPGVMSDRLFDGCSGLKEVVMPQRLTAIGENAFRGTVSLTGLSFAGSLRDIGASAFYGSGLESADFSKCGNLTSVGDFAFAGCEALASVKFGGAPQLGVGVFFGDAALSDFVLPGSITVIPAFTFKGDTSLPAESVLHNAVTEIGDYALTGWVQITELALPTSLHHIGDNAMEGMAGLTEISAVGIDGVPTLGIDVWKNVEQAEVILYVDESEAENYRGAEQWNRFMVTVKQIDSAEPVVSDVADSGIEYQLRDNKLVISSKGAEITEVEVFDLGGKCRYLRSASARTVAIDTAGFGKTSAIVVVTLADGTRSSVKVIL